MEPTDSPAAPWMPSYESSSEDPSDDSFQLPDIDEDSDNPQLTHTQAQKQPPPVNQALKTPTRVINISQNQVNQFLDSSGIPLPHRSDNGQWAVKPTFSRLSIHPGSPRWPNLVINHYTSTSSVLFQGPLAVAHAADLEFRQWLGNVPKTPH